MQYLRGLRFIGASLDIICEGAGKMVKRICLILLVVLFLGLAQATPVFAVGSGTKIILNDKELKFDVAPMIKDDYLMVPLREIAEHTGAKVEWDGTNQVVTITMDYKIIKLQVNNSIGYVNEKMIFLQVPPVIVENRVLLSLRFFSENMEIKINQDSEGSIYLKNA